jgi:hypothetical protein
MVWRLNGAPIQLQPIASVHGADGIETTFTDRILPVDTPARLWDELSARRTLPVIDTLIAADGDHPRAHFGYPKYPRGRRDRRTAP